MNAEQQVPPEIEPVHAAKKVKFDTVATGLLLIVAAIVLFSFDPRHSSFYPGCMFKHLTGWSCPACGCLRASHQLLHGNISVAFHLNPFYIVLLPVLGWLGLSKLIGKRVTVPTNCYWILLIVVVLFGVLRNLPSFAAWSAQ